MMRFLVLFLLIARVLSAEVEAKISLSADHIKLTDRLKVYVQLNYPEGYKPDIRKIKNNLLLQSGFGENPFLFDKEQIESPKSIGKDLWQQTLTYTLEPQMLGQYPLTLRDIDFVDKAGKIEKVISPLFEITVEEEKKGPEEPMVAPLLGITKQFPIDISPENRRALLLNGQIEKEQRNRDIAIVESHSLPWFGIFTTLLVVLFFIVALSYKPRETEEDRQKRLMTLRDQALNTLQNLKQLPQQNDFEQFYVQLTNAVRTYIEQRYQIQATTQTTEEFLTAIASHPILDENQRAFLKDFLTHADRVKFARYEPSIEECDLAIAAAQKFIGSGA